MTKPHITVRCKVNRLELAWTHFRAQDYPRPHRLEVLTDRSGPCDVARHGPFIDTIVAAPIDRRIVLGGIDGEAALAIVRRDRNGYTIFAASGESYRLAADGAALQQSCGEAMPLFEWGR